MTTKANDTCPSWPAILAWLENDHPDEEAQLLNTHVADCNECRERLALMNAVQDVEEVGQLTDKPPRPTLLWLWRSSSIAAERK